MKVVEKRTKQLVAHQFTDESKDDLFMLLHWYKCSIDPSFDEENTPIMKIRFGERYEEKTVSFGDWVVLDNSTNTVVEVINNNDFNEKYESGEHIHTSDNFKSLNDIINPCSSTRMTTISGTVTTDGMIDTVQTKDNINL